VPEDIAPDANGNVIPGTGGMSCSPGSIWKIPAHRRPRGMARGSSGPPGDRVYGAGIDALGPSLRLRPDPRRPDDHVFIEPDSVMLLADYVRCLVATRPEWKRAWP
jgi:hypothetical protein